MGVEFLRPDIQVFGGVVSWCLTYSGIRPYGHQWAYFGCSHVEAAPARLAVIRLDGLRSDDVSSLNWTCVGDPAYYESILATTVKPRSVGIGRDESTFLSGVLGPRPKRRKCFLAA